MKKKKNVKVVNIKPLKKGQVIQIDLKSGAESDKKIDPKKIFEGYTQKKVKKVKVKSKY
tara:strand:- start:444 stop:620 length:177 start_codon:yes stop_codon:yes gene_type:complete